MRYLAPEIIRATPTASVIAFESKPADVFAFAMVATETFAGEKPFEGQGNPKVVGQIFRGGRPVFPQNAIEVGLTPQMGKFLRKCWRSDPALRPAIDVVVQTWEGLIENNEYA